MSELTGPRWKTDDSHVTHVNKTVPITRDTDGTCTDMNMTVMPDSLRDIKEEPEDVCYTVLLGCITCIAYDAAYCYRCIVVYFNVC